MSLPRTVLLLGLLISLTDAALADIAPSRSPLPKPPMVAPVKIVDGNVDNLNLNVVAKIVIPSSLLPDLQEASHATRVSNESPFVGTIIAGLALSAFAISMMLSLNTSPQRKMGLAALIGCILVVGLVVLANFFFPRKIIAPPTGQSKSQQQIIIEVQQDGHEVTLILPHR